MKKSLFFLLCGFAWGLNLWLMKAELYNGTIMETTGTLCLIPSIKCALINISVCALIFFFISLFEIRTTPYAPSLALLFSPLQLLPQNYLINSFFTFIFHDLGIYLLVLIGSLIFFLRFRHTATQFFTAIAHHIEKYSLKAISSFLFFLTLAIYISFSIYLVHPNTQKQKRNYLLTGDEPQYLLVTHSLVFDKDFNLYNNVENKDSLLYSDKAENGFSGGFDLYHKYARGKPAEREYWDKKMYSITQPGFPILISPFYKIGTLWDNQIRLPVIFFLNILSALLVTNIFLLSFNVARNKFAAFLPALAAGLSMPILFYSRQIYPDLAAALLLLYSFRIIYSDNCEDITKTIFLGTCVSFLPWLHEKHYLTPFFLSAFYLYRNLPIKKNYLHIIFFFLPIVASYILQGFYYNLMFGVCHPVSMHPSFSFSNFIPGGIGLLLDEGHGLIPYSPIFLLAMPCAFLFFKTKNKTEAIFYLAIPVSYFISTAFFKEWWGGFCPAGRYLLPAVSFITPLLAYGYTKISSSFFKTAFFALGIIGITVGISGMFTQGRLYQHMHPLIPYSNLINLRGIFPNAFELNLQQCRLIAAWLGIILSFSILTLASRRLWTRLVFFAFILLLIIVRIKPIGGLNRFDKLNIYDSLTNKYFIALFSSGVINYKHLEKESVISYLSFSYEAEDLLVANASKVSDDSAANKIAVFTEGRPDGEVCFIFGPYETLPKGNYSVSFRIKTDADNTHETICKIDVASKKGKSILASRDLKGSDFKEANTYEDFKIDFSIDHSAKETEFRVYTTDKSNIWVDKITIKPTYQSLYSGHLSHACRPAQ